MVDNILIFYGEIINGENQFKTLKTLIQSEIFFENTEGIFQIIVNEIIYDEFGMISECIIKNDNLNFEKYTDLKVKDVIEKKPNEIFKNDMSIRLKIIDKVIKTGKIKRYEYYSKNTMLWYDIQCFPFSDGLVGELYRDITEQKENEIKLAIQAEILSNAHNAVVAIDENNLITYCNKAFTDLFGWQQNELLGKQNFIFFNESSIETESKEMYLKLIHNLSNIAETFAIKELTSFSKDGRKKIVDLNISKFKVPNKESNGLIIVIHDVGKHIQDLNKLRQDKRNAQLLIEDLHRAEENRNNFLNMFSHELRNPLAAAKMSLSLLNNSDPNSASAIKAKITLNRQLTTLSVLVDDLLDVTRIKKNKVKLNKEIFEINELVVNIIADHNEQYSNKEVNLIFDEYHNPLYIKADKTRIIQVIDNLLNNAVKFTKKGDTTTLKVKRDENNSEVMITVKDTGVGIDPKFLPLLFVPFNQVDNSLGSNKGGLGLGLAIVKGMLELHGGSVEVFSEGIGKGTCFTIRLPLLARKEEKISLPKKEKKLSRALNVLMIDDNKDLAEIMCELINLLGHKAEPAFDGIEGLTKAKEINPDVIICDIGLPVMDGYEVAKNIRESNLNSVYLIALSGYAQQEDIQRSIKSGFNKHLAKPLSLETLEATLDEVVYNIL